MAIVNETEKLKKQKERKVFHFLFIISLCLLLVGLVFTFIENDDRSSNLSKAKVELNLQKNVIEHIKDDVQDLKESIEKVGEVN